MSCKRPRGDLSVRQIATENAVRKKLVIQDNVNIVTEKYIISSPPFKRDFTGEVSWDPFSSNI